MSEQQPNLRLNSWKEIAEYLGREVRTAARWEKDFGLPVHRIGGGKGHSVFAYTTEIDEWLSRTRPNGDSTQPLTTGVSSEAEPPRSRRQWRWWIFGAASVLSVAVFAWRTFLVRPEILMARVSNGTLTAYNADKRALWTVVFDDAGIGRPPAVVDLNAKGSKEIVAFKNGLPVTYGAPAQNAELAAFSANGRELWRFTPRMSLKFGDQTYKGPWSGHTWTTIQSPTGPIFTMAVHDYVWWPAVVISVDAFGKTLGQFVSSGWVTTLAYLDRGAKPMLLAGGISNSRDSAMLAVLNPDHPFGSSPEDPGSIYECLSCPEGKPLEYFIFPRSELNRASGSRYNEVIAIEPFADRILVRVREVDPAVFPTFSVIEAIYEFTTDLKVRGFRFSDHYWDAHRHLEREGKLNHSFANDRTHLVIVRNWQPQSGWREISVPLL